MTTRISNTRETDEQTVHTSRSHERLNGRDGIQLRGTGIAFAATNSITDSGNGLAVFSVGDSIRVEGSASNNGRFTVTSVAAGTLGVAETVVTEAAGNSILLQRIG